MAFDGEAGAARIFGTSSRLAKRLVERALYMLDIEGYVRTSIDVDGAALVTSHYLREVLPSLKEYERYETPAPMIELAKGDLPRLLATSKNLAESQIEDYIIKPVLEAIGNHLWRHPRDSENKELDFCCFDPDVKAYPPNGFDPRFSNATAIIESKRWGRIENKYYVAKEDYDDEVWQPLGYLRNVNLMLENLGSEHRVGYAVLTDGYLWRIYSRRYTHDVREHESHFLEFDLGAILGCSDSELRSELIRLFAWFLRPESFRRVLARTESESAKLETDVTTTLREQTFSALEYIATGIWREKATPMVAMVLKQSYGVDVERAESDPDERARMLRVVYDESLVFLLRLLFVLYAEDRGLFDQTMIPKVIKGDGNVLDLIISKGRPIGELPDDASIERDDDIKLSKTFERIDNAYDGGLFSVTKHPLLYRLDIDDVLYADAIDNLCRVQIGKSTYTVDFSAISVRELGAIYEQLLEYKLVVADADSAAMPSIVNKKRVRHDVRKGDLYLVNHQGERKSTGSYYTPDLIVDHLVRTSLDPILAAIKDSESGSWKELVDRVCQLRIVDPAMGSGHMIQAAYGRIVSFLRQCAEEMAAAGKTDFIWTDEGSYEVRAKVAMRCIYGVDLNPMAVEIAKLVMWMRVFRPDKPFGFFDYNLACGNSLIGVYDESTDELSLSSGLQGQLFRSQEEVERDIMAELLLRVQKMMNMPRNTVEQVHLVDRYWREQIQPLQKQVSFFYNAKLSRYLLPEGAEHGAVAYDQLVSGLRDDHEYVKKALAHDPSLPKELLALVSENELIDRQYRPLHWKVAYPHVAVAGGFDVVLSNPPWDKVKPYRGEFFSDYIEGYDHMETADAKAASDALMEKRPDIKAKWSSYERGFETQNDFFKDEYRCQSWRRPSDGKVLKGDTNLYKVFLEKVFSILRDGGSCGIVIPDNINIDDGCTGLRHMLLENSTIKELVMFENRKKLFDIHGQYKFDVLTFEKKRPRVNAAFYAGFYWYDPIWLDGTPDMEYQRTDDRNAAKWHSKFRYSTRLIRELSPETLTVFEFRNTRIAHVFEKMLSYPALGDSNESLRIRTYREFDMTNDSDLFRTDGMGWPLFQGKTIHHFNAHFHDPERSVVQSEGEERLSKRWGKAPHELPDRTYRGAWRDIAQPTDTRSLICTVVPRGVFTGNKLDMYDVIVDGAITNDPTYISGVNVMLSSFVADFYVRQRIAKTVNAFIVKNLPVPRELELIRTLGDMAMPLYQGEDFEKFRGGVSQIDGPGERAKLIARLDARVALAYELSYEDYQTVLGAFPLIDDAQKNRCLNAYKEWSFEL